MSVNPCGYLIPGRSENQADQGAYHHSGKDVSEKMFSHEDTAYGEKNGPGDNDGIEATVTSILVAGEG